MSGLAHYLLNRVRSRPDATAVSFGGRNQRYGELGARTARIAGALVPGNYWVQVRHFSRASGAGEYTIRVRRG